MRELLGRNGYSLHPFILSALKCAIRRSRIDDHNFQLADAFLCPQFLNEPPKVGSCVLRWNDYGDALINLLSVRGPKRLRGGKQNWNVSGCCPSLSETLQGKSGGAFYAIHTAVMPILGEIRPGD